jgi:protein-tyrosine phosphatase
MIDLNNHLLGEDGSAVSQDKALESCELAWRDGVREIVVTCRVPLSDRNAGNTGVQLFEQRLAKLRQAIELQAEATAGEQTLPSFSQLKLAAGYEWMLSADLPELLADFPVAPTINGGSHLLVGFPALQAVPAAAALFERLMTDGWRPIIAHPECSRVLRRDRALLNRLTAQGALVQLDATSLLGGYGQEVERFALDLLERNQVHFIATRTNHRSRSQVSLAEACQRAARLIGRHAAQALVGENALEVLMQTAEIPAPLAARRWQALEAALG